LDSIVWIQYKIIERTLAQLISLIVSNEANFGKCIEV